MIGYLVDEWRRSPAPPEFVIADTRGPGPLAGWPRHMAGAAWTLVRHARRRPLAYIHVAGRGSSARKLLLVALARMLGEPVLLHLHDYDYEDFCRRLPRPALGLVRWMFRRADHVIVLGEDAHRTVTGLLGVPVERISILANAVPAPTRPATLRAGGEVPHLLFLGQLSERKGVHDLIAALDRPELRALPWRATIAGGGPHQQRFADQLAATAIADRVALPGWVDRPTTLGLLENADVLVLPSYAEGMAMSVLEGIAYGLAVVSTPVGALREVLEDGRSALLVEPGDIAGLAAALARVVADPALRAGLGAGAAARFRAGYDAARYPGRLAPIIDRALAHRAGRPAQPPGTALPAAGES
jgi:glycosyltransferase involved in cell wall biosynthesis